VTNEEQRRAKISASMKKRLAEHPEEVEARRVASTGHRHTEQAKKKMSVAAAERERLHKEQGYCVSAETRQKISRGMMGRMITWGDKISASSKGKQIPQDQREAISRTLKEWHQNNPNAFLGKQHTQATKERLREANTGKFRGEDGPNWQGGVSSLPYGKEWTRWLRQAIRQRDGNACRFCSRTHGKMDVHHIDFDKDNNTPTNLICLCASCHGKANTGTIAQNLLRSFLTA
jgi:hypothetical protein